MHGKAEFRSSIAFTISFATAVALLVLLVVVAARAQNPVPPTAREAAASPALASKLHPATRPATKKPRASAAHALCRQSHHSASVFAAAEPGDLRERAGQRHHRCLDHQLRLYRQRHLRSRWLPARAVLISTSGSFPATA